MLKGFVTGMLAGVTAGMAAGMFIAPMTDRNMRAFKKNANKTMRAMADLAEGMGIGAK
ncbi:MAG: hypothetical protein IJC53_01510 [Clostridia bacterium]|nr:hypothetical protein [Clostridia bacterium]